MDVYAFVPEYADEEEVKATYVAALGFAQQSNQQLWIYVNNKHTCPFLEPVLGGPMLRKLRPISQYQWKVWRYPFTLSRRLILTHDMTLCWPCTQEITC